MPKLFSMFAAALLVAGLAACAKPPADGDEKRTPGLIERIFNPDPIVRIFSPEPISKESEDTGKYK